MSQWGRDEDVTLGLEQGPLSDSGHHFSLVTPCLLPYDTLFLIPAAVSRAVLSVECTELRHRLSLPLTLTAVNPFFLCASVSLSGQTTFQGCPDVLPGPLPQHWEGSCSPFKQLWEGSKINIVLLEKLRPRQRRDSVSLTHFPGGCGPRPCLSSTNPTASVKLQGLSCTFVCVCGCQRNCGNG